MWNLSFRNGKLVIRPDSGDPIKIICGDSDAPIDSPQFKGLIECLWDLFGGTYTNKGYKVLDSHIGAIYGDSITLQRAWNILHKLYEKGFSSTNIVLGIGSFTYQYVTRDTYGFAMKATYGEVDGIGREIFKDPKTDKMQDGISFKKSAKGLLRVEKKEDDYVLIDQVAWDQEGGELTTVFKDGILLKQWSLKEIRENIENELETKSIKIGGNYAASLIWEL